MTGISLIPQIPLRADKSHRSEMTSQILFGETYQIIDESDKWIYVKTDFDSYNGWIDKQQFTELIDMEPPHNILSNKYIKISDNFGNNFIISSGSRLPNIVENNNFILNNRIYSIDFENKTNSFSTSTANCNIIDYTTSKSIISKAREFLGSSYLWGGLTFMGFDCSGFVQTVFKVNGINLPRDSSQQVTLGQSINIIQETKGGELAFFGDEESISHVGILLDNSHIIHCSGIVRIDMIDNTGIFNGKEYTHKLRTIKLLTTC